MCGQLPCVYVFVLVFVLVWDAGALEVRYLVAVSALFLKKKIWKKTSGLNLENQQTNQN